MEVKHVQAELPLGVYDALVRAAKRQGRPLKAVAEDAIAAYVRAQEDPRQDPLFDFVGHGDSSPGDWSTQKDWRTRGKRP
ncbi:MAG: hypothetical protein WDA16_06560 [Candidatus Thermoplasmatota archaeon]